MINSAPTFRSAIANVEKASTGEMLRKALATYTEPDTYDHIFSESSDSQTLGSSGKVHSISLEESGWSGAIPLLNHSHLENVEGGTDPTWFIPPVILPGEILIDFDPNYKYIDQDGNELDF